MSEFKSFGLKSFKVTERLRGAVDALSGGKACSCVTPRVCEKRRCSDEISVCTLNLILCGLVGRGELPFLGLRGRLVACESGRGTLAEEVSNRAPPPPISTKRTFNSIVLGTYTCSTGRQCRAPRGFQRTLRRVQCKTTGERRKIRRGRGPIRREPIPGSVPGFLRRNTTERLTEADRLGASTVHRTHGGPIPMSVRPRGPATKRVTGGTTQGAPGTRDAVRGPRGSTSKGATSRGSDLSNCPSKHSHRSSPNVEGAKTMGPEIASVASLRSSHSRGLRR